MPVCTNQPPGGFVGTFLVGTRTVGARYRDATCGIPTCGQALCGMWWAYLCPAPLGLGGTIPDAVLLGAEVPPARLTLSAYTVQLQATSLPQPGSAVLGLGAFAPALKIISVYAVLAAGLRLGAVVPSFAGQTWMDDAACVDVVLAASACGELILVPSGVTTIDLETEVCR